MDPFTASVSEKRESAREPAAGGMKRPGSRRQLRAVFSRFSLVYLLTVLTFTLLSFIPDLPDTNWFPALLNTFLEDIWYYGPFFLFFSLLLSRYPMIRQSDLPATCPRPKVLQILAVFLFAAGISYFFRLLPGFLFKSPGGSSSESTAAAYLLVSLFDSVIMVPVIEEFIFRRMLQDRLMFLGSGTALLLASLFFSLAHMNPVRYLYTFFVGMILGSIHMRTGKMRWNILLHMSLNALTFAIGYMGSTFGFLWIFGTILFAAVYLIVRRPWRGIVDHRPGIPVREKLAACLSCVPFWVTVILLIGIAVLKQWLS